MSLAAGTRIGPYEVVGAIGAGGMGEVYQARDTKLHRDVALKILPESVAGDADRVTRLRREAQVLASLNHPNIGQIYGFEDAPAHALVMEFVPGPTLDELGRVSLDQALAIATQVADAIQAAHEHGVIHRDLKPSNIKVTPDGSVKVLDFGLAKALGIEGSGGFDLGASPPNELATVTRAGTRSGVILGTAAYMSPEQARGRPVDKRTDIWSFGCVLYEMLTGRPTFEGDNVTDLLAGIVGRDPDFKALPAATPAPIRRVLRRCLERDRKRRLSDIADARLEIEEAISPSAPVDAAAHAPAEASRPAWIMLAAIAATAIATSAVLYWWLARDAQAGRPMRFVIAPPASDQLYTESIGTQIAVSPDGQSIVYVGIRGGVQLYHRRVDQLEAQPIPGTQGARQPFFSPDGRAIGFWSAAEGELRRIAISGGPVSTICRAPSGNLYGAWWGPDDTIVFGSGPLYRVPAVGGTAEVLTTPDAALGEAEHRWPEILPDGRSVLFTAWAGTLDRSRIAVRSLQSNDRKTLVEGATSARYSATGHIVYYQTGSLMTAPYDAARMEISAERVPIPEPVRVTVAGAADFAVSRDGMLVLVPGSARAERKLVSVDRKGVPTPLLDSVDDYWLPRFSPDGTRLAVGIGADIWTIELTRVTRNRVTYGSTSTLFPYTWSRDSQRILFSKVENKVGLDIYSVAADGSGQPELLLKGENRQWATSVSPTSDMVATYEQHPTTLRDIWMLGPDRSRMAFLATPYQERAPRFSPDGRWVAYVSNDSTRDEVYIRPASGLGGKVTVSTEGGAEPVWASNSREIFYRQGDRMMVAAVDSAPTLTIGKPRMLFEAAFERDRGSGNANPNYDVTHDGQRFVMIQVPGSSSHLIVVVNWFEELKARLASRQK